MKRDYRRSGRGRKRSSLAEQLRQLAMLTAIRAPATTGPSGNFNIALRGGNYQITPNVVGAKPISAGRMRLQFHTAAPILVILFWLSQSSFRSFTQFGSPHWRSAPRFRPNVAE